MTEPLTEMSNRNLPQARTSDITAIYGPNVYNMWERRVTKTYEPRRPVPLSLRFVGKKYSEHNEFHSSL
jgi:hypothetical protein